MFGTGCTPHKVLEVAIETSYMLSYKYSKGWQRQTFAFIS